MKRMFDFVVSLLALFILTPVFFITSALIFIKIGRPVLFKQERPGKNGAVFSMLKFRTMNNNKDSTGKLLSDECRLTSFGTILRKTSLDELPGLWNVLKGDMSLVGPRPLLVQYLPLYNKEQARRHDVLPGITGWAQINGRNAISWEEKFALDVWYVDNRTFWLDIKILTLTVKKVFIKEGISAVGHVTIEPFTGSKSQGSGPL
ncbi:Uncharacterized sugar transferase EpsL [Vibrio chagasii]|nr:Uncharacterized sugar transferase EpsL [Vibrio chagasii]CAH7153410.1 Uncharacterized sugar transferase EpsL [Vibrio chagasii]CAH7446734.1 Uncharacterized sugar transferase EpsL [Vibrio chagasii]